MAALVAAILIVIAAAADMLFPPPLSRAHNLSAVVLDREDRWLHAFATPDGRWRFPADLDEVDAVFVERLLLVEDQRFWAHGGVDPLAVIRAAAKSARAGRVVSGASTITMQTARLLEPRPRTLASKLIEMLRALQIERRLNKRQILELYLTLAPYGGNLEGVRAASLSYFGKEPKRLTDAEQALLIALPQAPEARRPDRKPIAARAARSAALQKLADAGALTATLAAEAREAPSPSSRAAFPRAAYHVSRELAVAARGRGRAVTHSTLDLVLQRKMETLAATFASQIQDGATTAILVIDNRTRAVRAAVGSSSLDAQGGWIDLTSAIRSPGSTLKPFIYGLAFEDGLAGPDTVIDDMPQSFDGYAPENFDRTFRGEVRVSEALQHSLNLPAVRLLNELGSARLAALLRAAGVVVTGPKNRAGREFGLTLALGGAGITMRDLGALYSGLANDGLVRPLAWTLEAESKGDSGDAQHRLFSTTSARRINEILAEAPALAGRAPSTLIQSAPRVAFKTGTSYGYRDAWAAGHSGAYTVVAWVGRADGGSRPGETGRKAAAPFLMDAFDALALFEPGALKSAPYIDEAPMMIAHVGPPPREAPPEIVFPRDGVELFNADFEGSDARGYSLAARGGAGGYRWYVEGEAIAVDPHGGRAVWRPEGPGFYQVTVVDGAGRESRSKVRVISGG